MSGFANVAVLLTAVWLTVLTLVVLLLVRQLGLITARADAGGSFSVFDDGLRIGTKIPTDVTDALSLDSTTALIFLMSATCGPCREFAEDLQGTEWPVRVISLIPGPSELLSVLQQLLPPVVEVIPDPIASEIAAQLSIQTTPFGLKIDGGRVTAKTYLNSGADLKRLLEDGGENRDQESGNGRVAENV